MLDLCDAPAKRSRARAATAATPAPGWSLDFLPPSYHPPASSAPLLPLAGDDLPPRSRPQRHAARTARAAWSRQAGDLAGPAADAYFAAGWGAASGDEDVVELGDSAAPPGMPGGPSPRPTTRQQAARLAARRHAAATAAHQRLGLRLDAAAAADLETHGGPLPGSKVAAALEVHHAASILREEAAVLQHPGRLAPAPTIATIPNTAVPPAAEGPTGTLPHWGTGILEAEAAVAQAAGAVGAIKRRPRRGVHASAAPAVNVVAAATAQSPGSAGSPLTALAVAEEAMAAAAAPLAPPPPTDEAARHPTSSKSARRRRGHEATTTTRTLPVGEDDASLAGSSARSQSPSRSTSSSTFSADDVTPPTAQPSLPIVPPPSLSTGYASGLTPSPLWPLSLQTPTAMAGRGLGKGKGAGKGRGKVGMPPRRPRRRRRLTLPRRTAGTGGGAAGAGKGKGLGKRQPPRRRGSFVATSDESDGEFDTEEEAFEFEGAAASEGDAGGTRPQPMPLALSLSPAVKQRPAGEITALPAAPLDMQPVIAASTVSPSRRRPRPNGLDTEATAASPQLFPPQPPQPPPLSPPPTREELMVRARALYDECRATAAHTAETLASMGPLLRLYWLAHPRPPPDPPLAPDDVIPPPLPTDPPPPYYVGAPPLSPSGTAPTPSVPATASAASTSAMWGAMGEGTPPSATAPPSSVAGSSGKKSKKKNKGGGLSAARALSGSIAIAPATVAASALMPLGAQAPDRVPSPTAQLAARLDLPPPGPDGCVVLSPWLPPAPPARLSAVLLRLTPPLPTPGCSGFAPLAGALQQLSLQQPPRLDTLPTAKPLACKRARAKPGATGTPATAATSTPAAATPRSTASPSPAAASANVAGASAGAASPCRASPGAATATAPSPHRGAVPTSLPGGLTGSLSMGPAPAASQSQPQGTAAPPGSSATMMNVPAAVGPGTAGEAAYAAASVAAMPPPSTPLQRAQPAPPLTPGGSPRTGGYVPISPQPAPTVLSPYAPQPLLPLPPPPRRESEAAPPSEALTTGSPRRSYSPPSGPATSITATLASQRPGTTPVASGLAIGASSPHGARGVPVTGASTAPAGDSGVDYSPSITPSFGPIFLPSQPPPPPLPGVSLAGAGAGTTAPPGGVSSAAVTPVPVSMLPPLPPRSLGLAGLTRTPAPPFAPVAAPAVATATLAGMAGTQCTTTAAAVASTALASGHPLAPLPRSTQAPAQPLPTATATASPPVFPALLPPLPSAVGAAHTTPNSTVHPASSSPPALPPSQAPTPCAPIAPAGLPPPLHPSPLSAPPPPPSMPQPLGPFFYAGPPLTFAPPGPPPPYAASYAAALAARFGGPGLAPMLPPAPPPPPRPHAHSLVVGGIGTGVIAAVPSPTAPTTGPGAASQPLPSSPPTGAPGNPPAGGFGLVGATPTSASGVAPPSLLAVTPASPTATPGLPAAAVTLRGGHVRMRLMAGIPAAAVPPGGSAGGASITGALTATVGPPTGAVPMYGGLVAAGARGLSLHAAPVMPPVGPPPAAQGVGAHVPARGFYPIVPGGLPRGKGWREDRRRRRFGGGPLHSKQQ